jgi:hypothetical protein
MGQAISRQAGRIPVTIANGAALSGPLDLAGHVLIAIAMPAAWTAAVLTFQSSIDGGTTWSDVVDDTGTEVSVAAAASRTIVNGGQLEKLAPLGRIRIRSGTTGVPVNQAADRSLAVITKG